jgi:hypothetical protein
VPTLSDIILNLLLSRPRVLDELSLSQFIQVFCQIRISCSPRILRKPDINISTNNSRGNIKTKLPTIDKILFTNLGNKNIKPSTGSPHPPCLTLFALRRFCSLLLKE